MSYGLQAFIFAVRNEKSLVFEVLFQSFIAVACCTCPLAEGLILHSRPCDVPTAKKLVPRHISMAFRMSSSQVSSSIKMAFGLYS